MKKRVFVLGLVLSMLICFVTSCKKSDNDTTKYGNIEISNDIFSFQVGIDGKLYQLPAKPFDFVSDEWKFMMDDGEMLDSNSGTSSFLVKDSKIIMVSIFNDADDSKKLDNCKINKITIQPLTGIEVILPKGLRFDDELTVERLIEYYGEPDSITAQDDITIVKYKKDEDNEIMFSLYKPESQNQKNSMVTIKVKGL